MEDTSTGLFNKKVRLVAVAVGPQGRYVAGSSEPYKVPTWVDNGLRNMYRSKYPQDDAALSALIADLTSAGWEPQPNGEYWYSYRFRREVMQEEGLPPGFRWFHSSAYPYDIGIPSGWQHTFSGDDNLETFSSADETCTVAVRSLVVQTTLDTLAEETLQVAHQLRSLKLGPVEHGTMAGYPAQRYSTADGPIGGVMGFFVTPGRTWNVSYVTPSNDTTGRQTCERVLVSLRIRTG